MREVMVSEADLECNYQANPILSRGLQSVHELFIMPCDDGRGSWQWGNPVAKAPKSEEGKGMPARRTIHAKGAVFVRIVLALALLGTLSARGVAEVVLFDDFDGAGGLDTQTKWQLVGDKPRMPAQENGVLVLPRSTEFHSKAELTEPVSVEFKGVWLARPDAPSGDNHVGFTPGYAPDMITFCFSKGEIYAYRRVGGKAYAAPNKRGYGTHVATMARTKDGKRSVPYDLRIDWWPRSLVRFFLNGKLVAEYTDHVTAKPLPVGVRDEKALFRIGSVKVSRIAKSVEQMFEERRRREAEKQRAHEAKLQARGRARAEAVARRFKRLRIAIGGPCYMWGIDPVIEDDLKKAGMDVLAWPNAPMLDPGNSTVIGSDPMQFNVIVFGGRLLNKSQPDPNTGEIPKRIKDQVPKLRRFLEAGGGIWFSGLANQDWGKSSHSLNYILKELNLDAEVLGEAVMDTAIRKEGTTSHFGDIAWADVLPDELTEGVHNLLHPHAVISGEGSMGIVPILRLGREWRLLVRAKPTAASFPCDGGYPSGRLLKTPGAVKSSPMLCAVRQAGKGRVVLWPTWSNFTVTGGSGGPLVDGRRDGKWSDGARLIENLLCWLAEPSQGSPIVGTFDPKREKPIVKLENVEERLRKWARPGRQDFAHQYRGLIGAHSNLSDGKDSPEQMIAAAKKAGYDFIAFTEDLARMDEAKWKRLVGVCDKVNAEGGTVLINARKKIWDSQQKFSEPVSVEFFGVHLRKLPRSPNNQLGLAPGGHGPDMVVWAFDGSVDPKRLVPLRHVGGKDFWADGYRHAVRLDALPNVTSGANAVDLRIDWWPGKKVSYYLNGKCIATFTKSVPRVAVPVGVRDESVGYRMRGIKVTRLDGQRKGQVLLEDRFQPGKPFDTKSTWRLTTGAAPVIQSTPRFLAYPGLDLMDDAGNRGVVFGHRYWIKDAWRSKKHPGHIGWWYHLAYEVDTQPKRWFPRVIIHSQTNNKRPWNTGLWSFLGAYCCEGGKLVDDSFHEWRRVVGPHVFFMNVGIMAIHTARSVEEVASAARPGLFQTYVQANRLDQVLGRIRGCVGPWPQGTFPTSISAGPEILDFARHIAVKSGEGGFVLGRPDQDRALLHILVKSDAGLRTVEVYDRERLVRRYRPEGKRFERFISFHPNEAHIYTLSVTDRRGRRAESWCVFAQVQEMMHRRCGDNWNWMTPGGRGPGTLRTPKFSYSLLEVTNGWRPREPSATSSASPPERVHYSNPMVKYGLGGFVGAHTHGAIWPGHQNLIVDGKPWEGSNWPSVTLNVWTIGRYGVITSNDIAHELIIRGKKRPYSIGAFSGPYEVAPSPWPSELVGCRPMNKPDATATLIRYWGKVRFVRTVSRADGGPVQVRVGSPSEVVRPMDGTVEVRHPDGRVERQPLIPGRSVGGDIPLGGYVAWFGPGGKGLGAVIAMSPGLKYGISGEQAGHIVVRKDVPAPVKPGTEVTFDTFHVSGENLTPNSNQLIMDVWEGMGVAGKPTLYKVEPRVGRVTDQKIFLTLAAEDGAFSGRISKTTGKVLPIRLPVMLRGLNTRWSAVIWYRGKANLHTCGQFRDPWSGQKSWRWVVARYVPRVDAVKYIPILDDGAGYCQVETDQQDPDVFIGHPLVCDRPEVFLSIVKLERDRCTFEINNPTDKRLACTVRPARGFDLTGAWSRKFVLPPGGFEEVTVKDGG